MEPPPVRIAWRRREIHAAPLAVANDGSLPSDILHEVLLRLPANVLCRLRLVCRSWSSLTSDPIFTKAHLSRHPLVVGLRNVAGLPGQIGREVQFVDLSGNIVKRICITGLEWDYGYNVSTTPSLLCTPTTKKSYVLNPNTGVFIILPANITAEHENKSSPIQSHSLLGWIPSTSEYKVLRIHRYLTHRPEQTCEVMRVSNDGRDGRWVARASPLVNVAATPLHGVVVSGVAYFLLEVYNPANVKWGDIASFDFDTEEWRSDTLRGPPKDLLPVADEQTRVSFHLAKLKGCLVTICRYNDRGLHCKDQLMDLWFSVDMDKGLWTKMYSLQCTSFLKLGLYSPLEVLNDGRILIWLNGVGVLRAYDPKTNILTDLVKLSNFSGVCLYQGSLLCQDIQD